MKPTPMNTSAILHAALHLLESLGYCALITALVAITQYTSNHDHIDFMQLLYFVLPQVALCLSLCVAEYLKTVGQSQIGTLVQTEATMIATKGNIAAPDISSFDPAQVGLPIQTGTNVAGVKLPQNEGPIPPIHQQSV